MSAAIVTDIRTKQPYATIANVYELFGSEQLGAPNFSGERRGHCLSPSHDDANPSCNYNPRKHCWHCPVCNRGGGVLDLVLHAKPDLGSAKEAREWLRTCGLALNVQVRWDSVSTTFDYTDEEGALLYQVGRWEPKAFGQRVPDGHGGWTYKLKGVPRVPFMLPQLSRAIRQGETIYVVEGEKDAKNLYAHGLVATTNAQGATWPWPVSWSDYFKNAKQVVVIADNDDAGREAARRRASIIACASTDVRIIDVLPDVGSKGDISDWFAAGGTVERLAALAERAPRAKNYEPAYPEGAVDKLVAHLDDTGNGQWFTACVGSRYRYLTDARRWLRYDGRVWTTDVNMRAASENVVTLMEHAQRDYDGPHADDFGNHVQWSRSLRGRDSMVGSAEGPLGMNSAAFDANPLLLNLLNGTLDLSDMENISLRSHNPDDHLTFISPVKYDRDAQCPTFRSWLREAVNDSDALFGYMQALLGSCLEGRSGLRRFYFIFGPKSTGKSTFIRIIEMLLGNYQCATDFKALSEARFESDGNAASPAIARLKGRRMVSASEVRDSQKMDVAKIKQLIGGDSITARQLFEGINEFKFEATLIMIGNEMPRIIGDESIWDKFKPVPFEHTIECEDPNYEKKVIVPELPGILNFALEGLRRLRAVDYQILDPEEVVNARDVEMNAQDPFADWFAENMERASDRAPCDLVYADYAGWCVKNKTYAFKRPKLSRWLKGKRGVDVQQANVNKFYVGIRPRLIPGNEGPAF